MQLSSHQPLIGNVLIFKNLTVF
ncbi:rCG47680 [Rattus norvegicus]|uniref:RCG47680 n=1 Tax=Rattus norvegicus TaxID=10116 RepID=A6I0Y8_RAT|nr:rCG47680 [Rattus norvegicus]